MEWNKALKTSYTYEQENVGTKEREEGIGNIIISVF